MTSILVRKQAFCHFIPTHRLGEVKRVNVTVNPVGAVEVVKTGLSALKGIVVNPFTK